MNSIFTPVFPLSTFIISCLELFILFFAIVQVIADNNTSNRYFLILILLFLQMNVLWGLMPNYDYSIPMIVQHIILFNSTAFLAVAYFYYLHYELDFNFGSFFTIRFLIISVVCVYCIFYLGTYFLTGDLDLARKIYIGFPAVIITYYCYKLVLVLFRDEAIQIRNQERATHFKTLRIGGTVGFFAMATMPYILMIGFDQKGWSHLFINLALLMSTFNYFKSYFWQYKKQRAALESQSELTSELKKLLTKREFELSYLLAKRELSYDEIGKIMFISGGTVSKHASNIFRKTDVPNRTDFISKYFHE